MTTIDGQVSGCPDDAMLRVVHGDVVEYKVVSVF